MTQIRWPVPSHSPRQPTRGTIVIQALTPDVTPRPESLARSRAIGGNPVVNPSVVTAAITRSRAQGSPTVSPTLTTSAVTRTRAISDITVTGTLTLQTGAISRERALGAVTANPQLLPASITRTRAQGDLSFASVITIPTAIRVKAHTPKPPKRVSYIVYGLEPADTGVSVTALERTRALGVTSLSPRPASITRTRALGAASIPTAGTITVGGLTSVSPGIPLLLGSSHRTRTVGATQLAAPLPASLVRTRVSFAPRVDPKINTAALVRTRALGTTASIAGGAPAALEHSRALGTHTLNPSTLPASLIQVRFIGNSFVGDPDDFSTTGLLLLRGVG